MQIKDKTSYLNGIMLKDLGIKKLKILNEATYEHNEKFNRDQLKCQVEADNKQIYVVNINATNADFCKKRLGADSRSWIGAVLYVEPTLTTTGYAIKVTDAKGAVLA